MNFISISLLRFLFSDYVFFSQYTNKPTNQFLQKRTSACMDLCRHPWHPIVKKLCRNLVNRHRLRGHGNIFSCAWNKILILNLIMLMKKVLRVPNHNFTICETKVIAKICLRCFNKYQIDLKFAETSETSFSCFLIFFTLVTPFATETKNLKQKFCFTRMKLFPCPLSLSSFEIVSG